MKYLRLMMMRNRVGGLSNKWKKFFFIFFFFSNLQANTVYDYETNIFFKEIIDSIAKANNFNKNVSFIVILDDKPNAFVTENNNIIISSGLIKFSNSYEAIVGVLAHEIGHIDKFHVTKRKQSIEDLSNLNNLTNISILAGSLISNNSEYIFESLIGNKLGIQNYFQSFSREQEREADFYAINTLAKLNLSSEPLKNLLKRLDRDASRQGMKDEYYKFSSHPIYQERYEIINNVDDYKIIFNENINSRFNFIRAKFFGYTEENQNDIKEFLNEEYYDYAYSIILSKKGELKKSLFNLNKIIKKNKDNIHLMETKADILYSHGFFSEALLFYNVSIKQNPENYYIKKRIFDIKFSILDIYDNKESKALFNEYKFLLGIFNKSEDLKKKLEILALKNEFQDWINYFYIHENLNNKEYDKENLLNELKKIKKITSDYELIRLIDKVIL